MAANAMIPQHQAILTLEVEVHDAAATSGKRWHGLGTEFREWGGVGYESDASSVRPGSMAPPEAVPGTYTLNELTATRTMRLGRDSGLLHLLMDNKNCRYRGSREPVDAQGRTGLHRPTATAGIVTSVTESDYDVDGNEVATLVLTLQPDAVS